MCVPFRSMGHQVATTVVPIRTMRMSPIKWTLYFPMQMYVDWEEVRVKCISNTLRRRCCWKSTLRAHRDSITTRWRQRIMLRWNQWIGQHYTTEWYPKCWILSSSHTRGWYADSRNVSEKGVWQRDSSTKRDGHERLHCTYLMNWLKPLYMQYFCILNS